MWKRSFVATKVALGDGVDDALGAIGRTAGSPLTGGSPSPIVPDLDATAMDLVTQLRAPQRATRAAALAKAVRDIVLAIDEGTLR